MIATPSATRRLRRLKRIRWERSRLASVAGQMTHERRGSTAAQLKDDIDSGRTGDKVQVIDPAAAPVGTDEEAAGTPVAPETISQARQTESATPRSSADWSGPVIWLAVVTGLATALIGAIVLTG